MTPQARMVLRVVQRTTLTATRRVKLAVQVKRVKSKVLTALLETVLDLTAKTQKVVQAAIQGIVQVKARGMALQARMILRAPQRAMLPATRAVKLVKQMKRVKPKELTVPLVQMEDLPAKTQKVLQVATQGTVLLTVPEMKLQARTAQRVKLVKQVKPKVLKLLLAQIEELIAKTQKVVQKAIQKAVQVKVP